MVGKVENYENKLNDIELVKRSTLINLPCYVAETWKFEMFSFCSDKYIVQ